MTFDLSTHNPDPESLAKLERMMAEVYKAVPIRYDAEANCLHIAVSDANTYAIADIEYMLECSVEATLVEESEILAAVRRIYNTDATEELDDLISRIDEDEDADLSDSEDDEDEQ